MAGPRQAPVHLGWPLSRGLLPYGRLRRPLSVQGVDVEVVAVAASSGIGEVRVIRSEFGVYVLQLGRVLTRPQAYGGHGGGERERGEHGCRDSESGLGGEPPRERVGDQPAGVGEGELSREGGGQVRCGGRTAQQTPAGGVPSRSPWHPVMHRCASRRW